MWCAFERRLECLQGIEGAASTRQFLRLNAVPSLYTGGEEMLEPGPDSGSKEGDAAGSGADADVLSCSCQAHIPEPSGLEPL